MQKGRSEDHLSTWSPNNRICLNYRQVNMVMKIENPLHIHCKKDHHVGHKLELIICRHCEYQIFKEKIALNSTQTHSHSTCIQISLIMNSFTKFMITKQAHKKARTWNMNKKSKNLHTYFWWHKNIYCRPNLMINYHHPIDEDARVVNGQGENTIT
jgi:hypothetical protein